MSSKPDVDVSGRPLEAVFKAIDVRAPRERSDILKAFAGALLKRAPTDFFRVRSDSDIARIVSDLFELLESAAPDESVVRVKRELERPHAGVVEIVISDRPFVVDTLRQYLTSRDFEIRHILHPVVAPERDERGAIADVGDWSIPGPKVSLVYCEFDGHLDPGTAREMEDEIRECMADVQLATDDFGPMLDRLGDIADRLQELGREFPHRGEQIEEIIAFLRWLEDDGFIFLGYRGYDLVTPPDGPRSIAVERGSGLGILRRERESSLWEPKPVEELPADLQVRTLFGPLLIVSKANAESRVHRRARMDYVGIKKLDDSGEVVGEHRFLGLFTWKAYSQNAEEVPILREKLKGVLEAENVPEGSHDYKAIVAIFNSMPKEELFLVSLGDLRRQIGAIMAAEDTGEVRLVLTPDILGRGVNVMVILPERNYSDEVRSRLREELSRALGGSVLNDYLALGEGETSHLHFYLSAPPDRVETADVEALETRVAGIVRTWKQRLRGALEDRHQSETAHRLAQTYLEAFSPEYVARVNVDTAVEDIDRLELLEERGPMQVILAPHRDGDVEATALRLFVERGSMILADAMPTLENLGMRVIEADAVDVPATGKMAATIHTFVVQGPDRKPLDLDRSRTSITETLLAIRSGVADDDRFNSLVVTSDLRWRDVAALRAYSGYAFQIGIVSSRRAVMDALTNYPGPAQLLFEVFRARFDPEVAGDRAGQVERARAAFMESLQSVEGIGDDQTFRNLLNLVEATVRTSFFQHRARSRSVPTICLKVDCGAITHLARPKPVTETYVHGPRTEGAHLRFGPVARGGIRWSERHDDFRTELLGLVKTQQVKNAVIVPVGAKGAFVVRGFAGSRGELESMVLESYHDFIRALLDVTDNVLDGKVVHPPETVIHDGDDPYLVVAADRGTASFSDAANEIADEYGYWLADAFASGGSHGYDHKREGITARGTWECVRRHFREKQKNVWEEPVTVVGIGDMSGDVFGNGMLLSRTTRLLAAFDHRHIFIDPDPDPEVSYQERKRLFELPGSSWADYAPGALSQGGGVYPRGAKEIDLAPEARQLLGVGAASLNGQALIRAILRMPAELLWNGGIGTYVKSSRETHAEVGDSSNDPVRVNASELRVEVVGEGGNLGFTQLARIEYALAGGRVNTDAVDNSAGVDMSDHEVNLKILLHPLVASGSLTSEERNELLDEVTDDVAESVLANNRSQSRALSLEQRRAEDRLVEFRDALHFLEHRGGLDRTLEHLPTTDTLQERAEIGTSLTRPELAVLLAYSKMHLEREILESSIPDDPAVLQLLEDYFPDAIVARVSESDLRAHRLQREIIATMLSNRIVDLMGSTFVPRVSRDAGVSPATVARGWYMAAEIAGAMESMESIQENESHLGAAQEYQWLLTLEGILDRTVRWAVKNLPGDVGIGAVIEAFRGPVADLCAALPEIIRGSQRSAFEETAFDLEQSGVPTEAAQKLAALRFLEDLMEVTRISRQVESPVTDVGRVYFVVADEVDFAWLQELLDMAPGEDVWEQRAAQGLIQDLGQARRNLTLGVLATNGASGPIEQRLERFRVEQADRLASMRAILEELLIAEHINLAALTVATREVLRESTMVVEALR